MSNIMRVGDIGFAENFTPVIPICLEGVESVKVEGSPVAIVGSLYQNHKKNNAQHNNIRAGTGSSSVRVNGVPIHRELDQIGCPAGNHYALRGAKRTKAGG